MAMKREYLSVDGEIFGEVTNGVVNFYDRDALGSVVAIEDGAGNTVSTIEYKPFGDVRTYTGENPLSSPRRFLWCGTWGYRFNERYAQYTSHYVRARHYSSLQGMWSTVDPLYPSERAYGYVENRVTVGIDPSGMQRKSRLVPRKSKTCAVYACDINPGFWFGLWPGHRYTCVQILRKDGSDRYCSLDQYPSNYHVGIIGSKAKTTTNQSNEVDCPSSFSNVKCKPIVKGIDDHTSCKFADDMCSCMDNLRSQASTYRLFGNNCTDLTLSLLKCVCDKSALYSLGALGEMCREVTGEKYYKE